MGAMNVKKLNKRKVHYIRMVEIPGSPLCPIQAVIRVLERLGAIESEEVLHFLLLLRLLIIIIMKLRNQP